MNLKSMKTYSDLYNEYEIKYNRKAKHRFSHFVTILAKIHFHREYIRPQIQWWYNLLK